MTDGRQDEAANQPPATVARPARPAQLPPQPLRRILLSAFILLNAIAIFSWAVPYPIRPRIGLNRLDSGYMNFTGLWQSWDLFAPNPRDTNVFVQAEITYRNGDTRIWSFYRADRFGIFERMFKERYRKWANDNLRLDGNAALWPDVARYVARAANNRPGNPPQSVALIRNWARIPPPASAPSTAGTAAPWRSYVFYRYSVLPQDL